MNHQIRITNWLLVIGHSLVILVWSLCHSSARADSVYVGALERRGADIKLLRGDTLMFEINGRLSEVTASKITRVTSDSDPSLGVAESAYATGKWDEAVDAYQKTIRTTNKVWVRDWCALRLIDAASKSGRFDAAAAAYVVTLLREPNAATIKPTMPDSKSTFLNTAVAQVNDTLADPKLNVDQRRALLNFLVELQEARKDQSAEDAAFEQLAKLPGATNGDSDVNRILAKRKLNNAVKSLAAKNYQQALAEIDSASANLVDPNQQADALFIIAQARDALADNDRAMQDAAIAYMRVVALAKNMNGSPHVADSLLRTASLLDQLGQPQAAGQICQQLIAQYPNENSAAAARVLLARIKPNP